jgi:uncharacterized protein YqjF (DUF2071 family)
MSITDKFDHRPWPMPEGSWIQKQTWNNVLFLHWPAPTERIRSLLPKGLELETYDGSAWLGLVAINVTDAHLRYTPSLPFVSNVLPLNLRTYVRVGDKPGIYLFSADVSNALVVTAARQLFLMPYFNAQMDYREDGELHLFGSQRTEGEDTMNGFTVSYGPHSPVYNAEPGSLDHFLIERYGLYTTDDQGDVYRNDVHHYPWPLQRADAVVGANTLTLPPRLDLPEMDLMLCHYAHRLDALLWGLEKVDAPVLRGR